MKIKEDFKMNYQILVPLGILKDENGKELIFPSKDFALYYINETLVEELETPLTLEILAVS